MRFEAEDEWLRGHDYLGDGVLPSGDPAVIFSARGAMPFAPQCGHTTSDGLRQSSLAVS